MRADVPHGEAITPCGRQARPQLLRHRIPRSAPGRDRPPQVPLPRSTLNWNHSAACVTVPRLGVRPVLWAWLRRVLRPSYIYNREPSLALALRSDVRINAIQARKRPAGGSTSARSLTEDPRSAWPTLVTLRVDASTAVNAASSQESGRSSLTLVSSEVVQWWHSATDGVAATPNLLRHLLMTGDLLVARSRNETRDRVSMHQSNGNRNRGDHRRRVRACRSVRFTW